MDSGQAKCPMFVGFMLGRKGFKRKSVPVVATAQIKSPGVERGQPICKTSSSLVQPHVAQQASVKR